jgi:hypothetical protein
MSVRSLPLLLLVLPAFMIVTPAAGQKKEAPKETAKVAGLDRFKQLAGEWVAKEVTGGEPETKVRAKYKVTSAGSAIVETLLPDTEQEMVTIIHKDGDDLDLTHYCALGNQPHMKAKNAAGKSSENKIAFKFTHATNMKSDKDMHMHDVTYTFVDKDTFKAEWTHYKDGKDAGKVIFEYKRIK